jgi:hypothetical protein
MSVQSCTASDYGYSAALRLRENKRKQSQFETGGLLISRMCRFFLRIVYEITQLKNFLARPYNNACHFTVDGQFAAKRLFHRYLLELEKPLCYNTLVQRRLAGLSGIRFWWTVWGVEG